MKYVIKGIHTRKECMKRSPNIFNCEGLTALYNLNVLNFGILKNKSCHFILSTFFFSGVANYSRAPRESLLLQKRICYVAIMLHC